MDPTTPSLSLVYTPRLKPLVPLHLQSSLIPALPKEEDSGSQDHEVRSGRKCRLLQNSKMVRLHQSQHYLSSLLVLRVDKGTPLLGPTPCAAAIVRRQGLAVSSVKPFVPTTSL